MESFNVKRHNQETDKWTLIEANSPGHAARIYGAMLTALEGEPSMVIDVDVAHECGAMSTFEVYTQLFVASTNTTQ